MSNWSRQRWRKQRTKRCQNRHRARGMPRVAAAEQAPTEGRPGPKSRANAGRDAAATLDSDDDERLAHPSWSVSSLAGIGDTRVGSSTGRCLPEAVPTSFSASRAKSFTTHLVSRTLVKPAGTQTLVSPLGNTHKLIHVFLHFTTADTRPFRRAAGTRASRTAHRPSQSCWF